MSEKTLNNIRIINKHDTEANWLKATGFIPKKGEIIVYDKDSTYNYERFKIGDGSTVVSSLPFADANKVDKVSGKGLSTNDYTTVEKTKLANIADGANKTVVDGALSASSTNPVQNKVVNTAISNLSDLIGGTKVSEQITTAIASKSDTGHTHNYAGSSSAGGAANSVKANLTVKLNSGSTEGTNLFTYNGSTAKTVNITPSAIGAAASSHGNHVPATETANNAKFLRNDNTWQTVTPANIGAAVVNHGTHVSYSTTAPVMDGTASAGSASTVARSDHKHPTDTSRAAASDLTALRNLVGDKKVSEQIAAAQLVYVGPTMPTDPNIKVWINTAEEGTGVVPVLPRVSTISLPRASWSGSNSPYYQIVSINTVTSATKIELNPTVTQIVSLQNADIALMAENDGGTVKVYSFGGKPSSDMTMQVTLTEVSYV